MQYATLQLELTFSVLFDAFGSVQKWTQLYFLECIMGLLGEMTYLLYSKFANLYPWKHMFFMGSFMILGLILWISAAIIWDEQNSIEAVHHMTEEE